MNLIGIYLEEEYKTPFCRSAAKPVIRRLHCKLEGECPFLKRGKCIHRGFLTSGCIYGQSRIEEGPSKRAKSHRQFIIDGKKLTEAGPKMPAYPDNILEVVGDYVYVPHSFLSGCEKVPFVAHSHLLSSGLPFIKRESFTAEVVVELAKYRRHALMGGEITDIQTKSVPLFLFHLKVKMPELYAEAVKLDGSIVAKTLNPAMALPLKTTLNLISAGETGFTVGSKGAGVISWDGEILEIEGDQSQMGIIFPGFSGTDYRVRFRPDQVKTSVLVSDESLALSLIAKHPELINLES